MVKIKLFGDLIDRELAFLLPFTIALDVIIFLVAVPLYNSVSSVALGLLLGTVAMFVNMILLGVSVEKTTNHKDEKQAKRTMMKYYVIRFVIMGAIIYIGFAISFINAMATCIPLFYPKVCYSCKGGVGMIREKVANRRKKQR